MQYKREEKLILTNRIGVTKLVYDILRKRKRRTKITMAKEICNLVLRAYGKPEESREDSPEVVSSVQALRTMDAGSEGLISNDNSKFSTPVKNTSFRVDESSFK